MADNNRNNLQVSTSSGSENQVENVSTFRYCFFGFFGWLRTLTNKFFWGVFQGFIFAPLFDIIRLVFRALAKQKGVNVQETVNQLNDL
jgi:hypothetical protein